MRDAILELLMIEGVGSEDLPADDRVALLERLVGLYEGLGVLRLADPEALRVCCRFADSCWARARDPRLATECGAISLPWIGPRYPSSRVGMLGLNFNDAAGPGTMWSITIGNREALANGHRRIGRGDDYGGSDFIYRAARSAGLVLDACAGRGLVDREDPSELVDVIESVIRWQGVKCSPQNNEASRPTGAMRQNCVPFLLPGELEIARPRAVVTFGWDMSDLIERLPGFEAQYNAGHLSVGSVPLADSGSTLFFMVPHPRAAEWTAGQRELQAHLQERVDDR